MRTWLLVLGALTGLLAFQAWWFGRETPTERRLAAVAGAIAGAEVEVRCPSLWRRLVEVSSFDGTAHFDGEGRPTHAELRHHVCKAFDRLLADGFPADAGCLDGDASGCDDAVLEAARAVHVLSHEAWHLAGVLDEGQTECYAYQTDAFVAARFGASPAAGEAIARFAYRSGPTASLPQYRPPSSCRPGGALDLAPGAPGWPTRSTAR